MMDMLVTGIKGDILQISTSDFTIYLSGNSDNRKFRATNNNKNISGCLNVESKSLNATVRTLNVFGNLDINESNKMLPSFFEDGIYNIYLENDSDKKYEIYHVDKEIRGNLVTRRKDVYGSFKFNGDVGYSTFNVLCDGDVVLSFTIQVFPTKLDYMDDYNNLLKEVNDEVNSLIFDYLGKTFESVDIVDVKNQSGVEFIVILNKIFDDFQRCINRIKSHPKHGVLNDYNLKHRDKCKRVCTKHTISHLRKNVHSDKVIEVRKRTTLDIYENQYVKYIIKRVLKKIEVIKSDLFKVKGSNDVYYNKLISYENKLKLHLNTFFKDISDISHVKSMSLVFKMASGYKEVYYYYTLLSKGLDVFNGLYDISHKKLWSLYEIWCYIKIHNIIKELGYTPISSFIINVTNNNIMLTLAQGKKSKSVYINDKGNKIELWYNKSYNNLPTTIQRPDVVLCIKDDKNLDRIYIFDAKYRMYIDNKSIVGPMEDDINVMHRYRDSIVSESNMNNHYKYDTFGAYVMFPCSDEESFRNHKYYKSIDKVNIGAIPMLPGSTCIMKEMLCNILNESYIEAINSNPVFDESDDYGKFKNRDVMIVNAKDDIHLKAYKEHRFYHIPIKALSNVNIGVKYLAFYQPKTTFKNNSGIYYISRIKDIDKYERGTCKELSCSDSKSKDMYIRFELEEFEEINHISVADNGPITINYTTMYLLKNARYMHELYLKNKVDINVYKILRRYSDNNGIKFKKHKDGFYIGKDEIRISYKYEIRFNGVLITLEELRDYYSI